MAFTYKTYKPSKAVQDKEKEAEQNKTYKESSDVRLAKQQMDQYNNTPAPEWTGGSYGEALQQQINKINSREPFSYDLNADALYQQYKDQYINQGKLAMNDAIGTASALTGGYGNSYAASVGNQAYQSYLQKINDIVPELYQLAYNRYNQEGQDLKDQFNILNNQYNQEYDQYRDIVADRKNEMNRLSDAYYNAANLDYKKYSDQRDAAYDALKQERDYDYKMYSDAYNRALTNYEQDVDEYNSNLKLLIDAAKNGVDLSGLGLDLGGINIGNVGVGVDAGTEEELIRQHKQLSDSEYMAMAQENKSDSSPKQSEGESYYSSILKDIKGMTQNQAFDYIKQQWANGNLSTSEYSKLYNKIRG